MLLNRAIELRSKTPNSFIYKIKELKLFQRDYTFNKDTKIKMQQTVDYLERSPCFFMQSTEIINALYPDALKCSNKSCKLVKTKLANIINLNESSISENSAEKLHSGISLKNGNFIYKFVSLLSIFQSNFHQYLY